MVNFSLTCWLSASNRCSEISFFSSTPQARLFLHHRPPPSFQAFAHDWMWLLHPRDQTPQMMKLDYSCFPLINTSCQRLFDWHNLLLILLPKLIDVTMLDTYKTNMCLHVRTSSAIKLSSFDVDPCSEPAMQTFWIFFFQKLLSKLHFYFFLLCANKCDTMTTFEENCPKGCLKYEAYSNVPFYVVWLF